MPTAPPSPPTRSTPAETRLTVATFVAFMTASGQAQQILKARMLAADIEQGLGPLHLHALCLCQRSPGATQQQLVQSMGRDKGQMARLIRELEDRQLLVRTPDERDRRVWRLSLTPEGEQKSAWFLALEATLAEDLFGALGEAEAASLFAVLQTVQARMDGWEPHA
ncbi:MAG: MarR family transcriptional regulator [Rhodoferax sp.]|uniref:MarR family winged helix-turn-helix transcriptional regulator n=1 Tax=Rhodoferax sp. TaxID=50421 RepID=UPI002ACDF45A|nr:MarR family transcriptional regulator [Rhodoferax sp.]MDZ7890720.1 MarR family transcriptional regulator [Rhodoferax sp.]